MADSLKRAFDEEDDDDAAIAVKRRKLSTKDFEPRCYQVMIYEEALRRNTIAVLDTGSGKTMIAVMLMKEIGERIGAGEKRRLILFLAPTIHLVHQQYEVIKLHINMSTKKYYGAMGVDQWNEESWAKEICTHQVMVMTPQILLDTLRKAFLSLDMIRLIIFDECHRAIGCHPYTKIMKEFYRKHAQKPSIFGMTASPLTRKEVNKYYNQMTFFHDDLQKKLDSLLNKFEASLAHLEDSPLCQFKDAKDLLNRARKDSSSWHGKISYCIDDLGLICASEAAKICAESVRLPYTAQGCDFSTETSALCNSLREEMMHAIEDCMEQDYEMLLNNEEGCLRAIEMGYISPKLLQLLQILKKFQPNEVRCLIFVERIITARVVERVIKKICYLSHLNVSYLTGGSSSVEAISLKLQKGTLELFRSGKVNLLFTTNVAEEGLDVPECSCVIRFDLPKTVCSYVQSRGRARQADSNYVVMLERGNIEQRELLFNIIKSKHSMMGTAINRDGISLLEKVANDEETEAFLVESTGATVTADSSVSLIYRYCEKLPKDKYYTPRPTFEFSSSNGSFNCILTLPPSAAFQKLVGPFNRSNHKAKQLVCLDACEKLHQMGGLDDHLHPVVEEPLEIDLGEGNEKSAAGAGTTKRKELHGTVTPSALSGSWAHEKVGVTLQGYKLNFLCNIVDQKYSSFILLLDVVLDEDVASLDIDLFLVNKSVKALVSPCGPIQLEAEQVEKAKNFQELLFNGVFGKLFKTSKKPGVPRKFILGEDDNNSSWNESYMYMLLPLESPCVRDEDAIRINWKGISSCSSVIKILRCGYMPQTNCSSDGGDEVSLDKDVVHFFNKNVHLQSLKHMVVMAIHTGKVYCVINVVDGLTANNKFETPDFTTYSDYFYAKYWIVFKHAEQPMLLVKQSHNPHNLLSSKFNFDESSGSKKSTKPLNNVHMPPELLVPIDLPIHVMKSLYLLPSLMHRMESLMLASQLRREIAFHPIDSCISSTLILEAITTLRCSEDFSSERLELLGDSVLKYALSCYLYLKFPEKHEGQLSSCRSCTVCNSMLHKVGIDHNLQGYIRDAAFDPRRWIAPGQCTNRPSPCKCEVPEAPCEFLHTIDDTSIVLGKACDNGHRWICSKTISDCVEALIGAYYVGGGLSAAIAVMKWLGIDVEMGIELVEKSMTAVDFISKADEIKVLESKIGYEFNFKGLLLEAITHASQQEIGINHCYQRLEFLGDAALDLLITWHLFNTYKDIDPGELTDLRSASVNNETFAQCAVKHNLRQHLQHASGLLAEQITEYVNRLENAKEDEYTPSLNGLLKGPKVLGDLVESIAGAMLIDTKLDLHKVWEIFEPLLSPIVTPGKVELPPFRELTELLSHRGYFLNTKHTMKGEIATAELSVQLENIYLVREGRGRKKKDAKGQAAFLLLKDLKKQGITRTCNLSETNKPKENSVENSSRAADMDIDTPPRDAEVIESQKSCDPGGPRTALFELCQKSQWPMPKFESADHKLSVEAAAAKGFGKNGLLQFVSTITLFIPNSLSISLQGEMKPDKKSSYDAAALVMLYQLEKQGRCCLKKV